MSFTSKKIEIRLTLTTGKYSNGTNTKIIRELPCSVSVQCAGLPMKDQATVKIYGMTQDDMEALTWLTWNPLAINRNKIEVLAGEENNLSLAFAGEIQTAVPEYNGSPDVYLSITAISAYYTGRIPVSPYSFKGNVPVASVLQTLAKQAEYTFVNGGDNSTVENPYLKGSPLQQIIQLKEMSGADIRISNGVITLVGKNKKILTVVSPENGLLGYPTPTAQGMRIRTLFNPVYDLTGQIKIENSIVPKANGTWNIYGISHTLGQYVDNPPWFSDLELSIGGGF